MDENQKRTLSDEEYIAEKIAHYDEYRVKLSESFWPNFVVNKQMYAGYDPTNPTKYQTNTARGMVESTVNKVITSHRKASSDIHGPINTINRKIEQTLSSIAESIFDDKKLAKRHGTYRANKEKLVRDLLTIGNCVGEMNYEYLTTTTETGSTRILADGVYLSPLTYDQYIFNPAYTWNTSPEKFIHKTASFESLKEQEERKEDGETVGVYKNLDKVELIASERGKLKQWVSDQGSAEIYSGTASIAPRWVEDLDVKVCWEGAHLCVIVEDSIIIREEYDPFDTGTDNIVSAMLIEEIGRPIGWGIIDHIRGLVQIKDDSLNQRKALLERVLKIGGLYDDTDPVKLNLISQLITKGGVVSGNGSKWKEINVINPGIAAALLSPSEIQGEIERSSLYSPYSSGQLSQETDKTSGTASGIKSIQAAAAPNDEVVLDKVEEQIDSPFINFSLPTIANASSDDDIRWIMRAGGSSESVGITKRFLQGRPTMDDMVQAGILSGEEAQKYAQTHPGIESEPYIDTDWIITITLDPSNASDKYQKAQAQKQMVDELVQMQQPIDIKKAYTDIAQEMGFEDFGQYFLDEKSIATQKDGQKTAQDQAMQMQEQQAQADHQRKLELLQASHHHEVAMASATQDSTPVDQPQPDAQHPVQKIAESMNFKDIPVEAQNAMLQMAGLPATAQPLPTPQPMSARKPVPVA